MKNPFLYVLTLVAGLVGGTMMMGAPNCPCTTDTVVTVDPSEPTVEVPGKLVLGIKGDESAEPGEVIELAATGNADGVLWASEANFQGPYNAGRVIVFGTAKPGRYVFWCFGNDADERAKAMHVVTVGIPPPPVVVPPVTPPVVTPDPTTRATRATYVYEQRRGSPPPPVLAALSRLNVPGGFVASAIDQDVINGKGQVPAQYAAALDAAKKVGLPCLVVEYTIGLPKVVPAPKTAADVEGAVK